MLGDLEQDLGWVVWRGCTAFSVMKVWYLSFFKTNFKYFFNIKHFIRALPAFSTFSRFFFF